MLVKQRRHIFWIWAVAGAMISLMTGGCAALRPPAWEPLPAHSRYFGLANFDPGPDYRPGHYYPHDYGSSSGAKDFKDFKDFRGFKGK